MANASPLWPPDRLAFSASNTEFRTPSQETLAWLTDVGYTHAYGPDLAPEGATPERDSYR
jgi:hypothetical protein